MAAPTSTPCWRSSSRDACRADPPWRAALPRGRRRASGALRYRYRRRAAPALRGALVIGAASVAALRTSLERVQAEAAAGRAPQPAPPAAADLAAPERLAIDYGDAAELADKAGRALKALAADNAAMWKALRAQGVFRGQGAPGKVAFLYTGQGSQYVNMLADLRQREPLVADVFAEADRVMTPLLGKPLSAYIFVDGSDAAAVARAEEDLRQTAITQPAVLATDAALTALLGAYGIAPDMVMGHSLGEYGALVAAGALPFADALEAVSARGREMSNVAVDDNGKMAAVFAPLAEVERILAGIDGYVVIANVNSHGQAVVGGASDAVDRAVEAFTAAGHTAVPLPVSHAFHTRIVAPASVPLRATLERLHLASPRLPIVANVDGQFYPTGDGVVPRMLDILARQVAEPVQFITGLETLYAAGARVFVEVGPKKALHGFVEDVLGPRGDVLALFSNHPKQGDVAAFNQALCGLYAAGLGAGIAAAPEVPAPAPAMVAPTASVAAPPPVRGDDVYRELGHLFADFLDRARGVYDRGPGATTGGSEAVVVSGAGLGLPGTARVFDDGNLGAFLHGEQLIDVIPSRLRHAILDKHITRLVKSDDGGGRFEEIASPADVIKLAARAGALDLVEEFGIAAERVEAYDVDTMLAVGAGLEALRDAGLPLVMRYRTTHKGTRLPAGWALPEALRDDTGIIFASVFPGLDAFADETERYHEDRARRQELAHLESLRARLGADGGTAAAEIDRRVAELRDEIARHPYVFNRRFLFRTLSMGHSQFAELIGARGPNTQINSACASTTQAFSLAEDWIRAGRCRRVIVVAADDATSEHMLEWVALLAWRRRHRRHRRGGGAAVRPPPPRHAAPAWAPPPSSSSAPKRRASAACSRSARCSARSPPTAPSTARASTSTTSAR
ncbi:MAG: acyltransferase domain-containing protein [Candidatus Binatia bacterium]